MSIHNFKDRLDRSNVPVATSSQQNQVETSSCIGVNEEESRSLQRIAWNPAPPAELETTEEMFISSSSVNVKFHKITTTDKHTREILLQELSDMPKAADFNWATAVGATVTISSSVLYTLLEKDSSGTERFFLLFNIVVLCLHCRQNWKNWKTHRNAVYKSKEILTEIIINRLSQNAKD